MKEIKAFIHRNRIADVLRALRQAGLCQRYCCLSVTGVHGTLAALDNQERSFSAELGAEVITEAKLELVLEDNEVDAAVSVICDNARTGQPLAGWIFVTDVGTAMPIGDSSGP